MAAAPEAAPVALSTVESQASARDRLKPGPSNPASAVAESQRGRFLKSITVLAAEEGYDKVTIRDLVAVAKVSSRAFYLHFGGKEDCLLAAHELLVRRAAKRIVASQAGERDWVERLRLAFRAAVREVAREPAAAQLVLVEAPGAGPAAREQARRADLSFAAMLNDSFDRAPDRLGAPPLVTEGIVAGASAVLRRALVSDQPLSNQTADELLEWALAVRRCVTADDTAAEQPFRIPSSKTAMRSRSRMADRDLILAAVDKLVAADGLDQLTVKSIRSAAGMTRQRFNLHFADLEDCVAAAAQRRAEAALYCAEQARTAGAEPSVRIEEAILAFCGSFAHDVTLTKLSIADACASEQISTGLGAILLDGEAREQSTPLFIEATAAMIWGVIRNRLCSGNRGSLCRISPVLARIAARSIDFPNKAGTSSSGASGEALVS